jgi:transposase
MDDLKREYLLMRNAMEDVVNEIHIRQPVNYLKNIGVYFEIGVNGNFRVLEPVLKAGRHSWDNATELRFRQLLEQGMKPKDIAHEMGMSHENIRQKIFRLKKSGHHIADMKRTWDEEKVALLLFLKTDLQWHDKVIAEHMGLTLGSVKTKIRDLRNEIKKEKSCGVAHLP